jgi:hypothetical protein
MTSRDAQLKAYREYEEALQEAEKKRPPGVFYKAVSEKGSEEGRILFDPDDDSLSIEIRFLKTKIPGEYLRSLYSALGDLVG